MEINELIGKVITSIDGKESSDRLIFYTNDLHKYIMEHSQDCCEIVSIEEIVGDLDNLIMSPILEAYKEESTENPKENHDDSYLWTFYRISTIKGTVVIRWYGESNGYYGIEVDFREITNK